MPLDLTVQNTDPAPPASGNVSPTDTRVDSVTGARVPRNDFRTPTPGTVPKAEPRSLLK